MTDNRLESAVERYENAIATIEKADNKLAVEQILEVLVARDEVQALLANNTQFKPGRLIAKVHQLDTRLKKQADSISHTSNLAKLREIIEPSERDWWWLLTSSKPMPWYERYDWLWIWLSLVFLTASASITIDIANRFLSGNPSQLGTLGIIAQSVMTLLTAGGALTKPGRKGVEHILNTLKIPEHFWDEAICTLSLLLLLVPIFIQSQLPTFAEYYKYLGDEAYNSRVEYSSQLASAERFYSRAIKIDPDDSEAHYKLGVLYEDLQELNQVIDQYQIAVKGRVEGESYKAYNRLARLYIINGSEADYSKAIALLRRAMSLEAVKTDKETMYAIKKNFGWARLKQDRYIEAKHLLIEAIQLFPNQAPAHCLLAQALEKLPREQQNPQTEWEHCLQYANQRDPDEDAWIGLALKRLEVYRYRQ
ncbi:MULTISPECIES: tetratricopeptide repeat protein [unclassified Coleofasciculus]|uniref:tetratricopeptide repeat protein n=1 Tax=unclassified Coleofasciculus TaxID=2692782 RepID=UPI0018815424|nr:MULTISPECIES: tetratricopeptide repeat protein [unclassified Coleofasciculus]MBE9127218.1 tetratricopeptide repeat protein [Coleofasciculus sp. LEGE 07081]MBE9150510.1 tetratricopeptide repeat protein [Coleofasciculus sp. LEGE 07092]